MRNWDGFLLSAIVAVIVGWAALPVRGQDTIPGERLDPATYGPGVVESMAAVTARDQYMPRPYPKNLKHDHGTWAVPSRRATTFPHSGVHNVVNKWGDTRMGIRFPELVDVQGAYFAGQAGEGAWTTGLRAVGYRHDRQVQESAWFFDVGEQPRWFEMNLKGVDRIEIVSMPVLNGGGWYGMDDLAYAVTDSQTGQPKVVVVDFEDLAYDVDLTGTNYAGLTWEKGTGEYMQDEGVPAPKVPPGTKIEPPVNMETEAAPSGTLAVLPALVRSFQGVIRGDAGQYSYPPDTCGAIGPNHYLEVVNLNVSAYDRTTGTRVLNISLGSFLPGSRGDPRVLYDQYSGRWIVTNADFDTSATIFLAVSTTNNPTGSWFKTSFVSAQGSDAGYWPDYPTLGVDANGIYITAYMVGGPGHTIFAIDKAPLIASTPSLGTVTAFRGLSFEYSIQPAHTYGTPSPVGEYFASAGASNTIHLRRVNPPLTAPTLTDLSTVAVTSFSAPPTAPALGSTTNLDTVDQRLMMAVYRNGAVWTAHTISSGGRAACRWYQIQVSPKAVLQSGTVSSSTLYYFFPSIMVNSSGAVVMGFTGSNSSQYAGCYYTGRASTDTAGTMATPVQYKAGTAAQNNIDSYGRNRWGDYSYTTLDPTDQTALWTIQEYGHTTNNWGTYIAQLTLGGDCNSNGIPDYQDIANGTSLDCNSNGIPDECDLASGTSHDCNSNGIPDECDIATGYSLDCNSNGVPDSCDLASGTSYDCNSNGIPDECDITSGHSLDCNQNGVPDECDPDCNHNGIPDACDITNGTSQDCNHNGIPDECDLASGTSHDCNSNGIPDECDIASGFSLDCNGNGVPDDCDIANCDGSPWCGDCNSNGIPDVCDLSATFQVTSPTYTPLGTPTVHTFTLYAPPDASGSVVLTFSALGDLFATSRYVNVSINNQAVGTAYGHSGYFSCSPNQIDTLSVPTATYNTLKAAGGGNVAIAMTPTTNMNPTACGSTPTTIQVTVAYPASSNAQDVNSNGIPDQCEPGACCFADGHCEMKKAALCTQAGGTYKGLGTTCTPSPCGPVVCHGDMNCDGRVTFADIDLFVAALSGESAWTHAPCPWLNGDCNGDLNVTFADIDPFVAVIGTTCP
jgi:hypothetical protein